MAMPSLPSVVGSPSPDGPRHPCPPSRCRLSGTACSPPAMCQSCHSVLVREEEQDERDGPSRCARGSERGGKKREEIDMWVHL
ncbi:hypothetical protein SETIT_5G154700v2 [Setaria italica]|uniref:Uncharacterized protein n=1 Tax=Setaria italica TaxID=4555 RepID=A0A368R527_SETIT|nr:hypothetical protein SETIT_5G154700v2 [Setaria italica]